MDIKKLQATIIKALEDVKAQDIVLFDTTQLTSLFDRMVIASGSSNRQTKALASSVRDKVKEAGGHVVGIEGEGTGEWVLVDLGDIIVHIMQPAIRTYYQLEEIWGGNKIDLSAAKKTARSKANSNKTPATGTKNSPAKKTATRTSKNKPVTAEKAEKSVTPKTNSPKVGKTTGTAAATKIRTTTRKASSKTKQAE